MAEQQYVLGSNPHELERLDAQAARIERPTRTILQSAGLGRGQRVLDLGTGLGHVARLAGELVGAEGGVVGVDAAGDALAVARARVTQAGERHVTFVVGDVTTWRAGQPFDAVTARLILFHLPDPVAAVRHHMANLQPDGVFVAVEFDLAGARTEPAVPLFDEALGWVIRAFSAAGASPTIGARLVPILRSAGLRDVTSFGLQAYLQPDDATAAALLGGVVRSLAGAIVGHGIATAEQMAVDTLDARLADALRGADAVMLPPTVVGAWGRTPR
jgi:SAM-dependent methyltransferase